MSPQQWGPQLVEQRQSLAALSSIESSLQMHRGAVWPVNRRSEASQTHVSLSF